MKVLTYYKYQCEECSGKYDTDKEALRCEEIHNERRKFSEKLKNRIDNNSHLWDDYLSIDFLKSGKDIVITPDMLFLSKDSLEETMTTMKKIIGRIKKITRESKNIICKLNNSEFSIYMKTGEGTLISSYEVDTDVEYVINGLSNGYSGYKITDNLFMGDKKLTCYRINGKTKFGWIEITKQFHYKDFLTASQYNLIMKEKLKGDINTVSVKHNGKIMVWPDNVSSGHYIN